MPNSFLNNNKLMLIIFKSTLINFLKIISMSLANLLAEEATSLQKLEEPFYILEKRKAAENRPI